MTHITAPTPVQLSKLVAPYLATAPSGLGLVIGYASPSLPENGGLFFAGRPRNQFDVEIPLDATTPFAIAGITKTFTATLYALLIRAFDPGLKIGDYAAPVGPMPINPALAEIALDQLVNYTSGLPADHGHSRIAKPPYKAYPYSVPAMLSYLSPRHTAAAIAAGRLPHLFRSRIRADVSPHCFGRADLQSQDRRIPAQGS